MWECSGPLASLCTSNFYPSSVLLAHQLLPLPQPEPLSCTLPSRAHGPSGRRAVHPILPSGGADSTSLAASLRIDSFTENKSKSPKLRTKQNKQTKTVNISLHRQPLSIRPGLVLQSSTLVTWYFPGRSRFLCQHGPVGSSDTLTPLQPFAQQLLKIQFLMWIKHAHLCYHGQLWPSPQIPAP